MLIEQESLKERIRDKDRIIEQLKHRGKEGFADREIIEEKDNEIAKLKEEITQLKKQINLTGGQIPTNTKLSHVKDGRDQWGTTSAANNSTPSHPKLEQKWGQSDSGLQKSGSWIPNTAIKSFIINPADTLYSSNLADYTKTRRSSSCQTTAAMTWLQLLNKVTMTDLAESQRRTTIIWKMLHRLILLPTR